MEFECLFLAKHNIICVSNMYSVFKDGRMKLIFIITIGMRHVPLLNK